VLIPYFASQLLYVLGTESQPTPMDVSQVT
jgi:hypothetical protein